MKAPPETVCLLRKQTIFHKDHLILNDGYKPFLNLWKHSVALGPLSPQLFLAPNAGQFPAQ